jgi:hypothetical protein
VHFRCPFRCAFGAANNDENHQAVAMTIVAKTPAYPRPVWDLVHELVDNELSIIPLRGKSPFRQWKGAQWYRANHATVTRWIDQGFGLGVVHGKVSRGLVSRDWDEPSSYQKWAADYPNLAATLPTVETSRGFHTYARTSEVNLTAVRKALHKPYSKGAIVLGDGELRCGTGCYNVIPPSVHPSGVRYRWAVPIPSSGFPEVDLFDTGFFDLPALGVTDVTHDVLAQARDQAASALGIGGRSVQKAKAVREKGCEALSEAVTAGKISVNVAEQFVRAVPDKVRQASIVSKALTGPRPARALGTRISGGTSFDVSEIEAAPPEEPRKPRNGAPLVSTKARTEAILALDRVSRFLHSVDRYEEFLGALSQVRDVIATTNGHQRAA